MAVYLLNDHFESNYEVLDVHLIHHNLGFSWLSMIKCVFNFNTFIWIKLGEI